MKTWYEIFMKPGLIEGVRIEIVGRRAVDKRKALQKLVFWLTFEMLYKVSVTKTSNGFHFFRSNEEESDGNQW